MSCVARALPLLLTAASASAFRSPSPLAPPSTKRAGSASAGQGLRMLGNPDALRVFLVRHGAVDLNSPGRVYPEGSFYGGDDVPLSKLGEAEARAASEFLKDEKIDMVFCSPLSRAVFGAERVAERFGITPTQDPDFREVDRGRWLGLTKEQIDEKFPGDMDSFAKDPTWCGHGGETYTSLFNRVIAARDRAMAKARAGGAKTICIVSHMWVTKSMVTDVMEIKPTEQDKWSKLLVPTASISLLEYPHSGEGKPTVAFVGTKPEVPADWQEAEAANKGTKWGG